MLKRSTMIAPLAICMALFVGACSSPESTESYRPLTLTEAEVIANGLHNNHLAGSAEITITVNTSTTPIIIHGLVDWQGHRGQLLFADPMDGIDAFGWENDMVYVRDAATGEVVRRPVDTENNYDNLALRVAGLAASDPDNAILVQQNPGAAYIGIDNGTTLLRYSETMTFGFDDQGLMTDFMFGPVDSPLWQVQFSNHGAMGEQQ